MKMPEKFCVNCKHYEPCSVETIPEDGYCLAAVNLVTGKPFKDFCSTMRGQGDPRYPALAKCGLEGKMFEPKEVLQDYLETIVDMGKSASPLPKRCANPDILCENMRTVYESWNGVRYRCEVCQQSLYLHGDEK
jgi:hypothetical protein